MLPTRQYFLFWMSYVMEKSEAAIAAILLPPPSMPPGHSSYITLEQQGSLIFAILTPRAVGEPSGGWGSTVTLKTAHILKLEEQRGHGGIAKPLCPYPVHIWLKQ